MAKNQVHEKLVSPDELLYWLRNECDDTTQWWYAGEFLEQFFRMLEPNSPYFIVLDRATVSQGIGWLHPNWLGHVLNICWVWMTDLKRHKDGHLNRDDVLDIVLLVKETVVDRATKVHADLSATGEPAGFLSEAAGDGSIVYREESARHRPAGEKRSNRGEAILLDGTQGA
jgi:hypothetical protein